MIEATFGVMLSGWFKNTSPDYSFDKFFLIFRNLRTGLPSFTPRFVKRNSHFQVLGVYGIPIIPRACQNSVGPRSGQGR
jgi:hypothetical protein